MADPLTITASRPYYNKRIWAAGINYYPLPQIAVKAECSRC
jgi:hypothetical protein